nr:MAG TPA: hypothetical protein [Caudoviricetes sp.]
MTNVTHFQFITKIFTWIIQIYFVSLRFKKLTI